MKHWSIPGAGLSLGITLKYQAWVDRTMRKDLAAIVCCPVHKSPLSLKVRKEDEAGDILEGTLHCATCPFDFPIEDGIPNLLPPSYHVDEVREPAKPARRKGK